MDESSVTPDEAVETESDRRELHRLLYGVRDVLKADVDRYWDKIESATEDDQFWRRGFVRAVFAFFEGLIGSMKLEALMGHKTLQVRLAKQKIPPPKSLIELPVNFYDHMRKAERGADFKPWEILSIAEWQFSLGDEGQVKFRRSKISLSANLCFAFRIHGKGFGVQFELNRQSPGWASFKKAIKIRDRLTHPRRLQDLDVTDDDVQTVSSSMVWIFEELKRLLELEQQHKSSTSTV